MNKILPIIVIYNEDITHCNIYHLVQENPELTYLLYDNSPTPINSKYANEKLIYVNNINNGGVTTAYNYGARYAKINGYTHIVLLDQDTIFEKKYFKIIGEYIEKYPRVKCFAPILTFAGDIPFSPTSSNFFRANGVSLKSGEYFLTKYKPVNSGACIEINCFELNKGYNEEIKLDFADFDFFKRLATISPTFILMDTVGKQQFSNKETDSKKLYNRFLIYLHDAVVSRKSGGKISGQVFLHSLALCLRTKDWIFIKRFISNYLLA